MYEQFFNGFASGIGVALLVFFLFWVTLFERITKQKNYVINKQRTIIRAQKVRLAVYESAGNRE